MKIHDERENKKKDLRFCSKVLPTLSNYQSHRATTTVRNLRKRKPYISDSMKVFTLYFQ